MPSLETRYRRLLLTYPADYRAERGDEIVGTLLDAARPGQRIPSVREAAALLAGGLRTRSDIAARGGGRALVTDAVRLGAVLLLAHMLGIGARIWEAVHFARFDLTTSILAAVVALAIVAVVRGATVTGAVLVLSAGARQIAEVFGTAPAPGVSVWRVLSPSTFESGEYLLILLVAALLAGTGALRTARRPWPWWVAAFAVVVPSLWEFAAWSGPFLARLTSTSAIGVHVDLITAVPAALLLVLAVVAHDPRPSLAAGLYVGGSLGSSAYALLTPNTCCLAVPFVYTLPLVLVALSVLTTVATIRTGRGSVRS